MAADDPSLPKVSTSSSSGSTTDSGHDNKSSPTSNQQQLDSPFPLPETSENSHHSSFSADTDEEVLIEEDDQDDGICPTCGIQLFKIRKKAWYKRRKTVLVPLTLTGIVEGGVCIACTNDTLSSRHMNSDDAPQERAVSPPPGASPAGETIYVGDYNVYGQRHGPGEMIWSNGDRYVGNFFNGTRDGQGTLWFADGSEYAGHWACNHMHGEGTRRFSNGDVYSGTYKNGKREGTGKFYFCNGDLYNGSWLGDLAHGQGKYFFASGKCFEGTFKTGSRHGKGKTQHPSGALDIFCYDMDRKVGNGVRWSANRKKVWLLTDNGRKQKRITIPEAVSIGYQCEGEPELLQQWQEFVRPDHLTAGVLEAAALD